MNKVVNFDAIKKQFTLVKSLGSGGTGDTHLLKDETTNMLFAFKKYVPKGSNDTQENYERFIDEIKILFNISHPNIVRVYNYYLYPQHKTGYLQMEYIEGQPIDTFTLDPTSKKKWSDFFVEIITAFEYLESKKILHRDIRASNIMIDKNENVKIIDFGFGKRLKDFDVEARSVMLNWPVTQLPNETKYEGKYDHQSEIYFVGKLLNSIIIRNSLEFHFENIIEKMIEVNPINRYQSFHEISVDISKGFLGEVNFSDKEKDLYLEFANCLSSSLLFYKSEYSPTLDENEVLNNLTKLIKKSSLEKILPDNQLLINCFIKNDYVYNNRLDIEIEVISAFYDFLYSLNTYKRKVVLDNIDSRLSMVRLETKEDDLPF
ncbi:protein kinase family protein [Exiguobacterium aurantiacum]|uniref:protein kinase family protein n=1 Tax=Exiguobacterium aurantiacum TaxID=33987 RepID=UPI00384D9D08